MRSLVEVGDVVAPTLDEINDRSKSDAFSKGVAILQTLWFIVQCIARRAEHFPITNLEVMTIAYGVMTVTMYIVWWHKPLNVGCPFRVPITAKKSTGEERDPYRNESIWSIILQYMTGAHDELVVLRNLERVPTFWSGASRDIHGSSVIVADIIALLVAMVFGAVHCIAWSSAMPTETEQIMWRASAVAIAIMPIVIWIGVIVGDRLNYWTSGSSLNVDSETTWILVWVPCMVAYVVARVILLVVSFTSLRSLPFAAYQTVQWTILIPHI